MEGCVYIEKQGGEGGREGPGEKQLLGVTT